MSKSNPPSKPVAAPRREFRPHPIQGRPSDPPTFQFLWPELHSSSNAQFDTYWKGIEAKFMKQVKEKILALEKEAYEKGFAQGEKDGLELGQKKSEVLLQQLKKLLSELERERNILYHQYGREMIHLILLIARKVIHRELEMKEESIVHPLSAAIQKVADRKTVIVHLNPGDYQYLLQHPGISLSAPEGKKGLKVIEDPSIQRGGCFLETSFGDVDATLEGQLNRVASKIWEIFEETGLPPISHP